MATPIAKTQIKIRRSTYDEWIASRANSTSSDFLPVGDGEITYDTTNNQIRIGNGLDKWQDLPFFSPFVTEPLRITSFSGYYNVVCNLNLVSLDTSGATLKLYRSIDGADWNEYGTNSTSLGSTTTGLFTVASSKALESGYYYRVNLSTLSTSNLAFSAGVYYSPITFNNYSAGTSLFLNKNSQQITTNFTLDPSYSGGLRLYLLWSDNSDFTGTTEIAGPVTIGNTESSYTFTGLDISTFVHGRYFYAEFRTTTNEVLSRFNGTTVIPFRYNIPHLRVLDFPTYNTVRVEYNRDLTQTYTGNHTIKIYRDGTEVPTSGNVITNMDIISETYTLTKTAGAFSVGSYRASLFNTDSVDTMPDQIPKSYTPITISEFAITDSNGWNVNSIFGTNPPAMKYAIYELNDLTQDLSSGVLEDYDISIDTVSRNLTDVNTFFISGKFYEIVAYPASISSNFYTHKITSLRLTSPLSLGLPTFPLFTILDNVATVKFTLGTDADVIYSTNPVIVFRVKNPNTGVYTNYSASATSTEYRVDSSNDPVTTPNFVRNTTYRAIITYADFIPTGTYAATIFGGTPLNTDYGSYNPFTTFSITSTAITQTTVGGTITGPSTRTNIRYKLFRQPSGGAFNEISGITSSLATNTFTLTLPGGTILTVGDTIYVSAIETGKSNILQSTSNVVFNAQGVNLRNFTIVNNSSVTLEYNINTATAFDLTNPITFRLYESGVSGTTLGTSTSFLFGSAGSGYTTASITPTNPLVFGKVYVISIQQSGGSLGSISLSTAYSPITIGTIVPYDKRYMKVPLTISATNFSAATLVIYKTPSGGGETQVATQSLTTSNTTGDYILDMTSANYMNTALSVSYTVKILVGTTIVSTGSPISLSSTSFASPTSGITTTYIDTTAIDEIKCYYTYNYAAPALYPLIARPSFILKRSLDGGSTYTTVSSSITFTHTITTGGSEGTADYNSATNNNGFIPLITGGKTTTKLTTAITLREGLYFFQLVDYDGTSVITSSSGSTYNYSPFTISNFSFGNYYTLFNLSVNSGSQSYLYSGLTSNIVVAIFNSSGTQISAYTLVQNRTNVSTSYQLRNVANNADILFTEGTSYYAVVFYNRSGIYDPITIQSTTMPFRKAFMTVTNFNTASFTTNRTKIVYTVNFTNGTSNATVMWYPSFIPLVGTMQYGGGGTYTYTAPDTATMVIGGTTITRTNAQLTTGNGLGFTPLLNTAYTMTLTIPTITARRRYFVPGIDIWQATIATADVFPDRSITPVDYSPTTVSSLNSVDRSAVYSDYLGFTCNLVGNSSSSLKFKLTNTTSSTITVFDYITINSITAYDTATPHTINIYDTDSGVATSYSGTTINIAAPVGSGGMVDRRFIVSNDYTLTVQYSDITTTVVREQTYSPIGYDVIILAGQSNMYGCDGLTGGDIQDPGLSYTASEQVSLDDGKIEVYSLNDNGDDAPYSPNFPIKNTIYTNTSTGHINSSLSYYYSPKGYGQNTTYGGGNAQSNTVSMGQEFVRYYKDYVVATNRKIIVIPAQKGNTGFSANGLPATGAEDWRNGATARNNLITAVTTCMNRGGATTNYNRLAAVLWHQGEFDSQWGTGTSADNTTRWVGNLEELMYGPGSSSRSIQFALPTNAKTFPLILGEMLQSWALGGNYQGASRATKYSHSLNKVGILGFDDIRPTTAKSVSSAGLHGIAYSAQFGDNAIHMSNRAERLMGIRYFQAFRVLNPYTRVSLPSGITAFDINSNQAPAGLTVSKTGSTITQISWSACTVSWNESANACCYLLEILNASSTVVGRCLLTQYCRFSSHSDFISSQTPFSWDGDQFGCWIPYVLDSGVDPHPINFSKDPASPSTHTITIVFNNVSTTYSSIPVYWANSRFNTANTDITLSSNTIFTSRNTLRFVPTNFLSQYVPTVDDRRFVRVYSVVRNGSQFEMVASSLVAL